MREGQSLVAFVPFLLLGFLMGALFESTQKHAAPVTAEAPEPPAEAPPPQGHMANKAGQTVETVRNSNLDDWFKRHPDFKIESITPLGESQVAIVMSPVKE